MARTPFSTCRAAPINATPCSVRQVCLNFSNISSCEETFVKSVDLLSRAKKATIKDGREAQQGDIITFRGKWGSMEAIILRNTERIFSFESVDKTIAVHWEFVPLLRDGSEDEVPRTFFKHYEHRDPKHTHFWERHGPFKSANEEELDKFNNALKKECERQFGGACVS